MSACERKLFFIQGHCHLMATLRLKERERARPRVFLSESEKVVSQSERDEDSGFSARTIVGSLAPRPVAAGFWVPG